jgi:HEAT repeat protein
VDTLLTAWDAGKFGDNDRISKTLKYLELDDLRLLLQGLAYWIHCYGSTGDQEGGTLIDREELLHQLSRMIRERHEFELYKAQAEAERIVVFIRERTGLLNEQGQDCYAFVHKTFQEYLTAEEIDYRRQSEDDFGILLEHIQQHLHDPHWQEVLLLLVAKQKGKQAARAIRTILNHGSAHEQWLHRDLFFAARCLAEDPKDIGRREQSLVNEVIDRLAKLEIYSLTYLSKKIREQVRTSLCGFSESSFENLVLARLTEDQNQINRWHFLEYQAALGAKDQAIKNLLGLIQDVAPTVRLKAINMLVQLNPPPDKVLVDTLLSLLQVSELQFPELSFYDEFIYDKAAYQLSILARKDILIEQKLLDSLSHPNPLMQYGALVALGYLGKSSDIIIQKILLLLEDADPKVCSEAIICLNCLGETSDVIIKRLLALLQESNFDYSKWEDSVIDIFSEFPIKRGQVKELLQLFEHPDELVRSQAVEIITGLAYGPSADGIREEILNLLNHSNLLVVASAIEVLGVLEPVSKPILDRLLTLFQNSSDIDLRCSVVWALGVLGQRCDKDIYQYICQGLFEALKAPELEVRFEALRALELLRPASKLVEQELFMLLQDQDLNVRLAAISALHISGRNSQPVIQQLLDLLQDPEPKIQRAVITALAGFGAISQPILTQLFKQLGDCELEVSLAILEVLEKSDGVSREIALKLINLLQGAEHPIQEKILSILSKRGKQEQDRDFITCKLIKWIEQHRGQTHMGLGIDTLWEIYN